MIQFATVQFVALVQSTRAAIVKMALEIYFLAAR
jgi:hypothetical protein